MTGWLRNELRLWRETFHMQRYLKNHGWVQEHKPPWLWRHPDHPASPCDFERAFLAASRGTWSPDYFDRHR